MANLPRPARPVGLPLPGMPTIPNRLRHSGVGRSWPPAPAVSSGPPCSSGPPWSSGPPCPAPPLTKPHSLSSLHPGLQGYFTPFHATRSHSAAPQPAPDFSAYRNERLEVARWLLARHARLANQRGIAALLLCLMDILAVATTIWLFAQSAQFISSSLGLLRLAVLLLGMLCLVLQFAALLLALAAALWPRLTAVPAAGDFSLFFHSGDGLPAALALLNNESDFRRLFRRANREQVLAAAQGELFRLARARQRQERFFLPALLCSAAGLLALFITSLIAFISII